jgi:hypothetical protein
VSNDRTKHGSSAAVRTALQSVLHLKQMFSKNSGF